MKYKAVLAAVAQALSSSTRRTWIEITRCWARCRRTQGRPPHGGRGLKSNVPRPAGRGIRRRPPHGGRGLKSPKKCPHRQAGTSSSTRRTWIEITRLMYRVWGLESSSTRRTWIEIWRPADRRRPLWSSYTRRTWIEIRCGCTCARPAVSSSTRRTWIEIFRWWPPVKSSGSSSTRRTWIEIPKFRERFAGTKVVLHTEDVD